jgi:predicted glycosyltransferase
MNIWLDLSNSPHINLFAGLIADLGRAHRLVITARPLANTVALLELHGLRHTVVGRHDGAARVAKACGYPVRVAQLWNFLRDQAIDVALSQSSFHAPPAARLLGVRSIYMNDNEHALGNVPAFLAASTILVPEFLSGEHLRRQHASPRKVLRYPGVKEGIYLHRLDGALPRGAQMGKRRPSVYVRPEPSTAQYYHGAVNFLDGLLLGLRDAASVTLLPRDTSQASRYAAPRFEGIRVLGEVRRIDELAPDCDLFIGAGGTMTREMAVLGVPTVSVYQGPLLDVDRYLLQAGAFVHRPALTAAQALEHLDKAARRPPNRELLEKGRAAYELLKATVVAG